MSSSGSFHCYSNNDTFTETQIHVKQTNPNIICPFALPESINVESLPLTQDIFIIVVLSPTGGNNNDVLWNLTGNWYPIWCFFYKLYCAFTWGRIVLNIICRTAEMKEALWRRGGICSTIEFAKWLDHSTLQHKVFCVYFLQCDRVMWY